MSSSIVLQSPNMFGLRHTDPTSSPLSARLHTARLNQKENQAVNNISTRNTAAPPRSPAIMAASLLFLVFGLGFLLANVPIIAHMISRRSFPVVFGIPLMGSSYTERLGMDFMIAASVIFQVVSALDVLAGYWLWKSDKRGVRLGLALLPIGLPFWILFQLPIFLVLGPLRAIALAIGWKSLR